MASISSAPSCSSSASTAGVCTVCQPSSAAVLVNQPSLQRTQKVILDHSRQSVEPQNCSVAFQAVLPSTSGRVR
jgi:hypothetical protein